MDEVSIPMQLTLRDIDRMRGYKELLDIALPPVAVPLLTSLP